MKNLIILLLITVSLLIYGCVGNYSVKETMIISEIPQSFKEHNTGIIKNPSDDQIEEAIQLGRSSKDKNTLEYAYIYKEKPTGFLNTDTIYVTVKTPLYLIANHAREQAREYKEIDREYINLDPERMIYKQ